MNKNLLNTALIMSLSACTGLEDMAPKGVSTYKLARYLFEVGIVKKVCLSQFITKYHEFHGIKLTPVSAQLVLNNLQRDGIISKRYNTEIKDFEYTLTK